MTATDRNMTGGLSHPQVHEAPQWNVSSRETFAVPADGSTTDGFARATGSATTRHRPSSQCALAARVTMSIPDSAEQAQIEQRA
jgi:hypothetical protein